MYLFTIYLNTNFHLSSSTGSLVITIEPKAKENISTAKNCSNKSYIFFSNIYYRASCQNHVMSLVSLPLQKFASAMLLLLIVSEWEVQYGVASCGVKFLLNFVTMKILDGLYRHTQTHRHHDLIILLLSRKIG
jgi:hypothetical protein